MRGVSGCLSIEFPSQRMARAVYETLEVEVRNPPDPDRGRATISLEGCRVRVCFQARDLAAARALLNAYLSLASSSSDAVAVVDEPQAGREESCPRDYPQSSRTS